MTLEEMAAKQNRTLTCAKLEEELPAMPFRPFDNELGERIFNEISLKAWREWIEHSKLIVNEYRLDLTAVKSHEMLLEQCEAFLFRGETNMPSEFSAEN